MQRKTDFIIDALHVFVLFGFAVAQPLFNLLGRNAEFFVAHRSEPADIIFLTIILAVLFPALVILAEGVAGILGRKVRKGFHGFVVVSLVAVLFLPLLKKVSNFPGMILLVIAIIFGIAAGIASMRFHPVRRFLTVLSPALVIFPILFLFKSPVSELIFLGNNNDAVYAMGDSIPAVDSTTPVVLVVFDEFSLTSLMDETLRIDPIRYPNFAALAQDAYWFRNATTVSHATSYAVPSIITGNYPDQDRLPTAAEYPNNLFTLLGSTYALNVLEPVTQLCPANLCSKSTSWMDVKNRTTFLLLDISIVYLHIILPGDIASGLPSISNNWKDFKWKNPLKKTLFKNRSQQFIEFINSINPENRPALYFLHIPLPHVPYSYLPSGKSYSIDSGIDDLDMPGKWGDDERSIESSYQRYLLQVGFVDTLIGKLKAHLKTVGLYDRSLVIITADHGVSFRPNDFRRSITKTNYQDILPVPLFIKAPDQHEGVISDRNVELIDIFPTVTDILGINLPWRIDGHSVLDPSLPEREEKTIFQSTSRKRFVFGPNIEAKSETLERRLALFGSGKSQYGLYKWGPYNDLVGHNINDLSVEEKDSIIVELDQQCIFDKLDPNAEFIPSHITGSVTSSHGVESPGNLAFGINGRIYAVAETFDHQKSRSEFSVVVPETVFRNGSNDVEVFAVKGAPDGQPELSRIQSHSDTNYSIASSVGLCSKWTKGRQLTRYIRRAYLEGGVKTVMVKTLKYIKRRL